jgi:hypothetical protein
LGTIGLVLKPICLLGRLQGVTKCDSGGVAGRVGSFGAISFGNEEAALHSLTPPTRGWSDLFTRELFQSYSTARDYVIGGVPDYSSWNDIRSMCIREHSPPAPLDRRLWTWEVRLGTPPDAADFEALVLSPEALKHLEALRVGGRNVPSGITVIVGNVGPLGVEYFSDTRVSDLLVGVP